MELYHLIMNTKGIYRCIDWRIYIMKFKAKPWKTGNSHVITIPFTYVENGEINLDQEYVVELREV